MQQVWPSSGRPAIDTRKILVWISSGCALCHLFRSMLAKPRFCSCSVCRDTGVASRLRSTGPLAGASVALHCMGTTLLHLARPFYAKSTWENVRRGGEEGSRWDGHGIYLEGDDGWAWTRCKGAWQASLDILGHSFGDVRSGFHGGFPWWVSMVGFHGGFLWWVGAGAGGEGGFVSGRGFMFCLLFFAWVDWSALPVSGGVGSEAGLVVWWACFAWKA